MGSGYSDEGKINFITCFHDSNIVNYINMVGKWFLSRCFQKETKPTWLHFSRLVVKALCGEKKEIQEAILPKFLN